VKTPLTIITAPFGMMMVMVLHSHTRCRRRTTREC
jgi:hypothetical protein